VSYVYHGIRKHAEPPSVGLQALLPGDREVIRSAPCLYPITITGTNCNVITDIMSANLFTLTLSQTLYTSASVMQVDSGPGHRMQRLLSENASVRVSSGLPLCGPAFVQVATDRQG
jgi:hypothetical protein